MGGDPQRRYLRFSFAADADPGCKGFERALEALSSMFRQQLRSNAPKGQCIAAYPEDRPSSDYALQVINQPDDRVVKVQNSEPPALWQIVDRRTNSVYAQLLRRQDKWFSCPHREVRVKFTGLIQPSSHSQ